MPEQNELATRPDTPLSILSMAVSKGCDPDALDKLLALQERWEANQARKLFAEAMHECQSEMPRIVRDKENTQTRSRYGSLERVQEKSQPIYSKHGFSLSYGEVDCTRDGWKRTVCDVRHVGGHCERYHLDLPLDGIGAKGNAIGSMNPIQAAISTMSYGQRKLLCLIFNITLTNEDDDGQAMSVVSEEQIAILKDWIFKTRSNLAAFLKWADVDALEKFPASKFNDAMAFFHRKAGTAK